MKKQLLLLSSFCLLLIFLAKAAAPDGWLSDAAGGIQQFLTRSATEAPASAVRNDEPNRAMYLPGGAAGTSSNVTIPALNIGSLPVTIEAWFKPEGPQNDYASIWFTRGGTTLSGFYIRPNLPSTGANELRSNWDGTGGLTETGLRVKLNEWNHAALVVTATTKTLYLNGQSYSYTGTNPVEPFDAATHLGWDNAIANRTFKGQLDEVRIWTTARTAEQLNSSKLTTLTGTEPGLKGYWRFDDGNTAQATDYSGNGFHGTINGGSYVLSDALAPMSFLSADGMQPTASVKSGSANNPVFRLEINTQHQAQPLTLSAIDINATGTTTLADIRDVHVYFTGSNASFSAAEKIGSLGASPSGQEFTVTTSKVLTSGRNYIWLAYDVANGAANSNVLDAAVPGFTLTGATSSRYAPATTATAGQLVVNNALFVDHVKLPADIVTTAAATPNGGANFVSFQQDAITTYNGYQYVSYWKNTFQIAIARKKLPVGAWEEVVLTDHTVNAARVADNHYNISIGIAHSDGTIHIAFDMHDDNLRYRRSVRGLANNPETMPWTAASFGPRQDHLIPGSTLTLVTYPRFVTKPNGDLLFETRLGGSGGGDSYLWEYSGSTGTWSYIGEYIDGRSLSPTQNAYINGIHYDPNGRLHVSWVWRETPDPQTNHDVYYGYSDDHGRTWKNSAGATVAQVTTNPMTLTTPGLLVKAIGKNRGLINQESQAVDSQGKIHILQSYLLDSEPNSTNFWNGRDRVYLHHIYQDENGVWQSDNIGAMSRNRSEIAVDENDNVYVVTANHMVYFATAADKWRTWTALDLSGSASAINEPLVDKAMLLKESVLSFVFAHNNGQVRVPYYLLDKSKPGTGTGLQHVTYSDTRFSAPVSQQLGALNITAPGSTVEGDSLSMRFAGMVETKYAEAYTLYLTTTGKSRVWVNEQLVLQTGKITNATEFAIPLAIVPSHKYRIVVAGAYAKDKVQTKLEWSSRQQTREQVPLTAQYGSLQDNLSLLAPASLSAQVVSPTSIRLNWTAGTNANTYNVKRSLSFGGPFETVAANVNQLTFLDTGLMPSTTYYYVVSSANLMAESANSTPMQVTTTALPAPGGVVNPRIASGDRKVVLTWDFLQEAKYDVMRADTEGGPYTTIATDLDAVRFEDPERTNNSTYYYKLVAHNVTGRGPETAVMVGRPQQGQHLNLSFNETAGAVAADLWGGYHATLQPTATRAEGRVGQGVRLDGTANSFVSMPAGIMSSLMDFTISTWVKMDAFSNWMRVFDFGSGTNQYMFLAPQSTVSNGQPVMRYAIKNGGAEQGINFTYPFPLNTWVHLAVRHSGNTTGLYINGAQVATNTAVTIKPADLGNTTQNYIGKSQWPDPMLRGSIDEFRIYNYALSTESILALASGPLSSAKELAAGLLVYPNPATSVINVKGLEAKTYQYQLFNLVGSVVAQGTVEQGIIRVPEKLSTGNYILQISENQTTVFRKQLLIQK